jgi:hypothetical protein
LFEGAMVWEPISIEVGTVKINVKIKNEKSFMNNTNIIAQTFKTELSSLVSRMIPIEDKINITELKAEQIIQGYS